MTTLELYENAIKPYLRGTASGCLEWPFARNEKGYGIVFDPRDRKTKRTHRVAWEAFNDKPTGQVLHICDNKSCVNIRHLYVGTHTDNVKDALERRRYKQGEAHYNTPLTKDQAIEILYCVAGRMPLHEIAKIYNITQKTVCNIFKAKTWRCIHQLAI